MTEPDHGALPADLGAGIALTHAALYAVERRRGWVEAPGSTPRAEDDFWDLRRAHELRMHKPRPGGDDILEVRDGFGTYMPIEAGAHVVAFHRGPEWLVVVPLRPGATKHVPESEGLTDLLPNHPVGLFSRG